MNAIEINKLIGVITTGGNLQDRLGAARQLRQEATLLSAEPAPVDGAQGLGICNTVGLVNFINQDIEPLELQCEAAAALTKLDPIQALAQALQWI